MNVFRIHKEVVSDYANYINSFIGIKDDRINARVKEKIGSQQLWPEPLIQFNPSYQPGGEVAQLCSEGLLHPGMLNFFGNLTLHRHQVDALRLGVTGRSFIVTSGTGSGKSLTFLGTIFNSFFNSPEEKGIKALLVYPMNALINSQYEEIQKYCQKYKDKTGSEFPFTFKVYTGQENQEEREEVQANPPDILLTNYMMLELIMTRSAEQPVKQSMKEHLRFLIFDELHTYRGRQGSDVAFLIRRIHAHCIKDILCIGTSATMASGETITGQKEKVAAVASTVFSRPFTTEQIIGEKLIPSLNPDSGTAKPDLLLQWLENPVLPSTLAELSDNPLAVWIEHFVALEEKEGILVRKNPIPFSEIASLLSEYTGIPFEAAAGHLQTLLIRINELNTNLPAGRRVVLPYKLNQFISQTGSVYVSLDPPESRFITLDPSSYISDEKQNKKPVYPVVFSRGSGHEFICVRKNTSQNILEPREFSQRISADEEDFVSNGYILFDHDGQPVWSQEDMQNLPDSWMKISSDGSRSLRKDYEPRIPRPIWFDEYGAFSETQVHSMHQGWFVPSPLLFDPTSGVFYTGGTSEGTKLTKLGTEGRSTATTVLSYALIRAMHHAGIGSGIQKLLSFTDNRQDAALQAGHFNDFVKVGRLRSAIYKALLSESGNALEYSDISGKVFKALGLRKNLWAESPSDLPFLDEENDKAMKTLLMYRILYDLRRSWRVILPNLEQCGLLSVSYKYLMQAAEQPGYWDQVELVAGMNPRDRHDFLQQLLDYFRRNYALKYSQLEPDALEKNEKIIKEKIKPEWGLSVNESLEKPVFMRLDPKKKAPPHVSVSSIGSRSYFGKYILQTAKLQGIDPSGRFMELVEPLLAKLAGSGYISVSVAPGKDGAQLYQLDVEKILWKAGDGSAVNPDKIRRLSYKAAEETVNSYFRDFYREDFSAMKDLEAREHTAQINNEERKDREERFRSGDISLLSCSPTMELGIDISSLNVVHLRNVPPSPANYAQRAGRAGRNGQGALIFTFCSNFSPHDQHYFRSPGQMVSGVVSPPRIDLMNEELLRSHLYAEFLSYTGLGSLNDSLIMLVDIDKPEQLPLKQEVRERLESAADHKKNIALGFTKVISGIMDLLSQTSWYSDAWILRQLDLAPVAFDRALDRWRQLFMAAQKQLAEASKIISDPLLASDSIEKRRAYNDQRDANRQLDALQNKSSGTGRQLSEFYPFRYLAAEGFLPGYNFTRLPVRAYVPHGDEGAFISRPRFLALREFAPNNIIYHNSGKFKVNFMQVSEAESALQRMKISPSTGYALLKSEFDLDTCPFSKEQLHNIDLKYVYTDLLPLSDTRSIRIERINCEEEERLALGYDISTFFTVEGGLNRIRTVLIRDQKDELLKIRYIPAATLIKVNERQRNSGRPGFLVNVRTGFWKKEADIKPDTKDRESIKRVRLITTGTADALYIHPMKALSFKPEQAEDAIITFQYALKRAIENYFQVESNEIGVEILGTKDWPNILVYEAAQGSLGVLSQVTEDHQLFNELIQEACRICYFEDGKDTRPDIGPASYADLLSYYNQPHHLKIDRYLIKEQLEKLLLCRFEVVANSSFANYDDQYEYLSARIDHSSSTERKFLDFLYRNNLRLPDRAQYEIPDLYIKPDFYYEKENACVFCDGTPHDTPEVKEDDRKKREALFNKGYDVVVFYYKERLEDVVSKRSDIFVKVR